MKVKLFYTTGKSDIQEIIWDKPEPTETQIEVQNIMTGVCSSDVAMFTGDFPTLPKQIQGHEGLGKVTKVGSLIEEVSVGDFVATRGEPAFADYYNVNSGEFVRVPKADPKYILEPVACGINIANALTDVGSVAIIGTGFLARVVHSELKRRNFTDITVYGKAYPEYWSKQKVKHIEHVAHHLEMPIGKNGFDYFVDFSSQPHYMQNDYVNENGMYIVAAEKKVDLDLSKYLWKNITIKCPSPRDTQFYNCMRLARELVASGSLKVDDMWCNSYNRDDAKTAFENRLNGVDKGRTYLTWQ
jgi:D-arabinose 1-dehydrogenase-like Zn-dependent alcohol dehydrogenase